MNKNQKIEKKNSLIFIEKISQNQNARDNPVDKKICWVYGVIQVVGVGGVADVLVRDFVEKGPQSVYQPLVQSTMKTSCFHFETVQVITQTPKQISIFFFQSVGH